MGDGSGRGVGLGAPAGVAVAGTSRVAEGAGLAVAGVLVGAGVCVAGAGDRVGVGALVTDAVGAPVGRAVGGTAGSVGGGWVGGGGGVAGVPVGWRVGTVCRDAACPGVAQTPVALTSVKSTNPSIPTPTNHLMDAICLPDMGIPPLRFQRR